MDALTELAPILGIQAAGDSRAVARAAVLAWPAPRALPRSGAGPHSRYAAGGGPAPGSVRTLDRLLHRQAQSCQCRNPLVPRPYQKAARLATAPNPLWSHHLNRLLGSAQGTDLFRDRILDVFSR